MFLKKNIKQVLLTASVPVQGLNFYYAFGIKKRLRNASLSQYGESYTNVKNPQHKLGSGSRAEVSLVKDVLGKMYVIKRTLPVDAYRAKKFYDTVTGQSHAHYFPTLHDRHDEDGHVDFLMEYCDGGDVLEYLRNSPTSLATLLDKFREMNEAMNALHNAGFAHRDIKPENFLICGDSVKLADFDFTDRLNGNWMSGHLGTEEFMAPDIAKWYNGMMVDRWSLATAFDRLSDELFLKEIEFTDEYQDRVKQLKQDLNAFRMRYRDCVSRGEMTMRGEDIQELTQLWKVGFPDSSDRDDYHGWYHMLRGVWQYVLAGLSGELCSGM